MPTALLLDAFAGVDQDDGRVGTRRAVTMFLTNSLWPGASMRTYSRLLVRNQICAVSIVMF